jgi:hypothetical protein
MSRRYKEPISVTLNYGKPVTFTWRGRTYRVQVLACWKLQDRWWDAERHADRTYWRVMTRQLGIYELYEENETQWVLDMVQDRATSRPDINSVV